MKNEIKLAEMKDLGEATKVKRRKAEEVTQDWEQVVPELAPIVKESIAGKL